MIGRNTKITVLRKYFPNVKYVDVSYNIFSDNFFEDCKKLKSVRMRGCLDAKITEKTFMNFKNLEKLVMRFCTQKEITHECFKYLNKIKSLNIQNCNQISDKHLLHLEDLKELVMTRVNNVNDVGISFLKNIEILYIGGCTYLTGSEFHNLLKLRFVSMWDCYNFKKFEYLSKVTHINVERCQQIKDDDLKHFKSVYDLLIGGCPKITDKGLKYLVKVQRLGIGCNPNITHNSLNSLKSLKKAIFNGCPKVDNDKISKEFVFLNVYTIVKRIN